MPSLTRSDMTLNVLPQALKTLRSLFPPEVTTVGGREYCWGSVQACVCTMNFINCVVPGASEGSSFPLANLPRSFTPHWHESRSIFFTNRGFFRFLRTHPARLHGLGRRERTLVLPTLIHFFVVQSPQSPAPPRPPHSSIAHRRVCSSHSLGAVAQSVFT